jgi:type II secretory pathway component PulJ
MTERWTDETLDRFASTVAMSITASNERMTRIDERLDRMVIEAERSKRESDERFEELTAVTQAIGRDMAQLITTHQQSSQALNEAMIRLADTQQGIARLLANLDEDRPTILRKLNTIEGKVDNLLQRENQSN